MCQAWYKWFITDGTGKHRMGLRQSRSPFTGIPTLQQMLETVFSILSNLSDRVLRFSRFGRQILHHDINVGTFCSFENMHPQLEPR